MIGYIINSSPAFEKDLDRLAKKFPKIRDDILKAFDKVRVAAILAPLSLEAKASSTN